MPTDIPCPPKENVKCTVPSSVKANPETGLISKTPVTTRFEVTVSFLKHLFALVARGKESNTVYSASETCKSLCQWRC